MKWAVSLLLVALLGAAPASLVVGSVRDQHGAPIEGARVSLLTAGRVTATVLTAADGTFSATGTAESLRIDCAYCRRQEVAVSPDGIAVAIVQRYDAIRNETPSGADIANLPYARIESDLSLAPFIILNQSQSTVPGTWLSDRNALPQTGLVVVNGVPVYDIVAGVSPFDTIPYHDGTSIDILRVDKSYTYGNFAEAGTFNVATTGGSSFAYAGDDDGLRANASVAQGDATAAWSNWDQGDRRSGATLDVPFADPGFHGDVNVSSGDADVAPAAQSALDSAFSSARASIESTGSIDAFATAIMDRGSYNYESTQFPASAMWSDSDITAGVRSRAAVAPFALIDVRASTGSYNDAAAGNIAATLGQAREVAGVDISQPAYDATFTLGNNAFTYTGGYPGALVNNGSTPTASGAIDLKLDPNFTFHASANRGYALQTFLGTYGPQAPENITPVDTISVSEGSLEYDSLQRVRASLTALRSEDQSGTQTSSVGGSLGWQIAPQLSLRTWLLREQSTNASSQMVGSAWLTYETPYLRADLIWRRDVLGDAPDAHVDGSVSGILTKHLRWFVMSERRAGIRATDVGIRL